MPDCRRFSDLEFYLFTPCARELSTIKGSVTRTGRPVAEGQS